MAIIDVLKEKAKADKKTIVLPESEDRRTYEAAAKILKEGIADIILVGSEEDVKKNGEGLDLTGIKVVDPATSDRTAAYIDKLVELCDMYQCKGPNEYKLEFDVATHKFDASYRYDNYTKSGISPVSELMSWYEEIKEKYGK